MACPQPSSPRTVLTDVILVISCGYEDKTDWGKKVSQDGYSLGCSIA